MQNGHKVDSGVNFLLVHSGKMEIQLYVLSRDGCFDCYIFFPETCMQDLCFPVASIEIFCNRSFVAV